MTNLENIEDLEKYEYESFEDTEKETGVELTSFEAKLKAQYKKIYAIDIELESVELEKTLYFKKPSTQSFNRVLKMASKKSLEAMKTFTIDNIVDEQLEEYKEILFDFPALAGSIGGKLLELLGATDNITIKKL